MYSGRGDSKFDKNWLGSLGVRVAISTISHPFDYAKTLIQIGHEPLPPYPTTSFFGKKVYALPNIFKYVKFIKSVDGYAGCYRGIIPKITSHIVGSCALKYSNSYFDVEEFDMLEDVPDQVKKTKFINTLIRDIAGRTASIVASHPFHVITIRAMAQFVGDEEKYCGVLQSILEIYREQGIWGFFAGIAPRWLGEIASLVLASTVVFAVTSYCIQDNEMKSYSTPAIQYITSALTYPFTVVSSCMVVNNCGLAVGLPPNMPIYRGWTDCWNHLYRQGHLNRGSSLLWRYYFIPQNKGYDLLYKPQPTKLS